MPDIKGQLIKNSYNYVLQSDLISGIVYRIGGDVPNNPKFISGLTVNTNFTYSNGSEVDGYVLTCDASGNATWKPVSGATPSSGVTSVTATNGISGNVTTGAIILVNTAPDQTVTISGGTGITTGGTYPNFTLVNSAPDQTVIITGGTNIQISGSYPSFGVNYTGATLIQGITGITGSSGVSAITNDYGTSIVNTAPDQTVTISGGTGITTGGTYPNFTLINSAPDQTVIITGGTNIQITGTYPSFGVNFTGSTSSTGDYLPLSGGTVTGGTNFTDGLTANTISATTYYNLPKDVFVTGGTYTSGNAIFTNNTGGTFIVTGFAIGGGGSQPFYLNISQSKNGNRYLSTTASTAAEQSTGVTIADGVTGTIASFQSDVLNATLIPGGIWAFYLHSYKQNNNASFNIFVEVYKRTSGGTETLLFTTDPTAVTSNSPNPSMQLSDAYFSGSPILVSDSIVARVRATNTSNQTHTITLFSEGSQHYSYAVSSIPTQQGLTCDTLSGCSTIQTIQTDVSNKFDKSGGTVNGATEFTGGLTANTISATTISGDTLYGDGSNLINVPNIYNIDGSLTGERIVTLSGNGITFKQDSKNIIIDYKFGLVVNNDDDATTEFSVKPANGLVTIGGPLVVNSGDITLNNLTQDNSVPYLLGLDVSNSARTFDANYIYNSITGGTYSGTTLYLVTNSGNTIEISGFSTGGSFTGGTVSGATRFISGLTANTISATTYQNLPATPFLPLSGGTVNGQLAVNSSIGSTLIVTSSNAGTSYGVYSIASNGVNAYGVYGAASAGEFESITNGIGGYFASDNSNGGNPTNRYSLQLIDGTEGVGKVLTSVTSDGKSNWDTPKTNGSNLYLFYNY